MAYAMRVHTNEELDRIGMHRAYYESAKVVPCSERNRQKLRAGEPVRPNYTLRVSAYSNYFIFMLEVVVYRNLFVWRILPIDSKAAPPGKNI